MPRGGCTISRADEILANILRWAGEEAPIRALVLVGSRAVEMPADELADFDIQVYADGYIPYIEDDAWMEQIGVVWVCEPEKYYVGDLLVPTRLIVFEDGVKVDFAFHPTSYLLKILADEEPDGCLVLLDKDSITAARRQCAPQHRSPSRPTEEEFAVCVREFWFEAYHVAKYLKRGDLWLVKFRDWATKEWLLKMIEWNEQARHDWNYNTYWMGKQMPVWASPATWQELHGVFGRFDAADSWRGLLNTLALFRRLAIETAKSLGYAYPGGVDRNIGGFILRLHAEETERAHHRSTPD